MSGICSEHQGHDPNCPRCMSIIEAMELLAEQEKRIAELEAAIKVAHTHLMNAQPHIAELPREWRFMDAHVDAAMTALVDVFPELMSSK